MTYTDWAESLPENCPPPDAYAPQDEEFFRLVESIPPSLSDFYSTRKKSPNRKNVQVDECTMRACSVFSSFESCEKIRKATPSVFKKCKIVKIILSADSGLIKKTLNYDHYSWWRCQEFSPIGNCIAMEE